MLPRWFGGQEWKLLGLSDSAWLCNVIPVCFFFESDNIKDKTTQVFSTDSINMFINIFRVNTTLAHRFLVRHAASARFYSDSARLCTLIKLKNTKISVEYAIYVQMLLRIGLTGHSNDDAGQLQFTPTTSKAVLSR